PVHGHGVRAASGAGYDDCCTSGPLQGRPSGKPHARCDVGLSRLVLATMLVGWTSSPCGCRSSGPGSGESLPAWLSSWSGRARVPTQLTWQTGLAARLGAALRFHDAWPDPDLLLPAPPQKGFPQ